MEEIDLIALRDKLRTFIRIEIIKKGTIKEACNKSGIPRSSMNNYLDGTSSIPQEALAKLHNACKINVYGFLASLAGVAEKYNQAHSTRDTGDSYETSIGSEEKQKASDNKIK